MLSKYSIKLQKYKNTQKSSIVFSKSFSFIYLFVIITENIEYFFLIYYALMLYEKAAGI